jgi:hypothetical protein
MPGTRFARNKCPHAHFVRNNTQHSLRSSILPQCSLRSQRITGTRFARNECLQCSLRSQSSFTLASLAFPLPHSLTYYPSSSPLHILFTFLPFHHSPNFRIARMYTILHSHHPSQSSVKYHEIQCNRHQEYITSMTHSHPHHPSSMIHTFTTMTPISKFPPFTQPSTSSFTFHHSHQKLK